MSSAPLQISQHAAGFCVWRLAPIGRLIESLSLPPPGCLYASTGPLCILQCSEDQVPADPHLCHEVDR